MMADDMEHYEFGGISISNFTLSLEDFLQCFPPPQIGRIAQILSDLSELEGLDIEEGDILKFHRKVNPNVPVSFKDPWGGADNWVKVTLPIEFEGKFHLLPFDPVTDDDSPDHVFHTVQDLIGAFPAYVQANSTYGNKDQRPDSAFDCGDRLKLIRLVFKDDEKLLECRLLNESRLLLLPLDCVGRFTALPDNTDYLLADLVSMLPRKRRVIVADDSNNQHFKIPGLPPNFTGDLFIEEPDVFVEASPLNDSGLIIGLPHTLKMTVNPDEAAFEKGQLLNSFATNNRNLFPVVARIVAWDEETTILENHFIKPGTELVIHGWTRQSKILAKGNDLYYAIPLTYQGKFELRSHIFYGVSDLHNAHPGYKLRVLELDPDYPDVPVNVGDILRIKREDTKAGEIKHIKFDKFVTTGTTRVKDVKIPINASIRFQEVLEESTTNEFSAKELVTFVTDQEMEVTVCHSSLDQKNSERDLPDGGVLTLCDFVVEPAVYVSIDQVDTPAFHIPLRTLLYVTFVEQLEKSSSPLLTKQNPKLSTLDRCVEILPLDVFNALRPRRNLDSDMNGTTSPITTMTPVTIPPKSPVATAWNAVNGSSGWQDERASTYSVESNSLNRSRPQSVAGYSASLSLPRRQQQDHNFSMTVSPDGVVQSRQSIPTSAAATNHGSGSIRVSSSHGEVRAQRLVGGIARPATIGRPDGEQSQPSPTEKVPDKEERVAIQSVSSMSGGSVASSSPSSPPVSPPVLQPATQPPDAVQVPPGYALVPMSQQPPAIPPGYMLVPMGGQSIPGGINHHHSIRTNSVGDADSIDDDATSLISYSRLPQFKVVIPDDGNLYHFSTKKMAEFLRQLRLEEHTIRQCIKDKIDGKKFARMSELDLERYGLLHPIVVHFRKLTFKRNPKFML